MGVSSVLYYLAKVARAKPAVSIAITHSSLRGYQQFKACVFQESACLRERRAHLQAQADSAKCITGKRLLKRMQPS
jgi:hypothetical protein